MRFGGGGAITQTTARFLYQSYFDDALLHRALIEQTVNDPIVASTKRVAQTPGYVVGLHPSSESPVALRFNGGVASDSQYVLTPGQVIHPGEFGEFEWGLPFGWLGGGNVLLYVGHTPDVKIEFPTTRKPVAFHRTRMVIDAAFPGTLRRNWPDAFPWLNAFAGANSRPQNAGRIVPFSAGPALFRLRESIAAPVTVNLIFRAVDLLDTDGTGNVSDLMLTTYDLSFPAVPAGSGAFPAVWLPAEVANLIGGGAALNIVDPSGEIDGEFVDVVRYGFMD